MGGQPKSEASSWSSAEVGRLWEEPTEAISEKQTERPQESSPLAAGRMSICLRGRTWLRARCGVSAAGIHTHLAVRSYGHLAGDDDILSRGYTLANHDVAPGENVIVAGQMAVAPNGKVRVDTGGANPAAGTQPGAPAKAN